jgi:polyisoprenyl-teichoic acid--peptidoglycan teichoic acid transferase
VKNSQKLGPPDRQPAGGPVLHRKPPRGRLLRVSMILLVCLLVILIAGYLAWQAVFSKVNILSPAEHTLPSEYNVPTEKLIYPLPSMSGITNILLLGVDTRDPTSIKERSDSMMILTLDMNNKKIKLTSLQRDMLVYLPGKTNPVKINAANAMGGPALALRVVNDTFRLDLHDFLIVNMRGMEGIVDAAGGVMIDVAEEEVFYLNQDIDVANNLYQDTPLVGHIEKGGLQLLNGRQAVGYARIRHLDSDYKRMARQRQVMQALLSAFRDASLATKSKIVSQGLSLVSTNMSPADLTNMALKVIPLLDGQIEQMQIPVEGFFIEDSGTTWVNRCDFNGMIPLLQQFIFGRTFPFDPVQKIPGAPNSGSALPTPKPTKAKTPTATPVPSASPTPQATSAPTTAAATEGTTAASETAATSAGTTAATTAPAATTAATTAGTTAAATEITTTAAP